MDSSLLKIYEAVSLIKKKIVFLKYYTYISLLNSKLIDLQLDITLKDNFNVKKNSLE